MSKHLTICMCLAMSVCMLGGCLNWSGDVDRYRQVLDGEKPPVLPVFEDAAPLSLQKALERANADNQTIAMAGEDYVQALAEKMRQAGTFLPTLSMGPSFSYSDTDLGTSHSFSSPLSASATGSLTQASNIQAAGLSVKQRELLLLDQRQTILLQVVMAYYAVLTAEKQTAVLVNSLELRQEQVRDQEARLKLGNVKPLDLAQSQANLAATSASLTQSRTDAANARSSLARLMGVTSVKGPLTDGFEPHEPVMDVEHWQQQALELREDYLASARSVQIARTNVDAAIRKYFPSISINFQYLLYTDPASVQNWSGGISANLPLFSALAIEADVRRSWSAYRQAGLQEDRLRRQVLDDVTQSYNNLLSSLSRINDFQVQVTAAQRAYDLSERGYQLGASTNLDRVIAQDNLLSAQLNLVREEYKHKQNYMSLLRVCGDLASMRLQQPE